MAGKERREERRSSSTGMILGGIAKGVALPLPPPDGREESFQSLHPEHRDGLALSFEGHGLERVDLGAAAEAVEGVLGDEDLDRKSTRLNSSHRCISYAVFCLKKKTEMTSEHAACVAHLQ